MKRISLRELGKNVLGLPRLPIPSLAATADRYRASLSALKTGDAATQHLARLDAFITSSAPVLQKHILEADKQAAETDIFFSYAESLLRAKQLSNRAPREVHINRGFVLKRSVQGMDGTQAGVAAAMVYGIARWIKDVVQEGVVVPAAAPAMDLSPLLTEFGRSLVPSKDTDTIFTTPLEQLRHIIVLHHGHLYLVKIFDDQQRFLDRALIQKAFELILSITPDQVNPTPVTLLTAGSRALWGQAYQELIKTPENAEALQLLHQSILVVCLDSKGWGDDQCLAGTSALHGGREEIENRCFDKHQMIVSSDGQVAFNFEPTTSECVHWARWVDDVLRIVAAQQTLVSTSAVGGAEATAIMRPVNITYGKSFAGNIRTARQEATTLVSETEVHTMTLPYGAAQLAALKVRPGAFVQILLQLARYMVRAKLCPTSELCTTASFFHGTTEVARSATVETLTLAERLTHFEKQQAVTAAAASEPAVASSTNQEELAVLIRAAVQRQDELVAAATCGKGIDRHLLALHHVAGINGDKAALAFFEDEVYSQVNTFVFQTGELSRPWLQHYAFGPACSSGYGLGYVVDENEVRLSLTAFKDSPITDVADLTAAIAKTAAIVVRALSGPKS